MAMERDAGMEEAKPSESAEGLDFEQAMQALEAISRRMDDPRLPLNEMLASFERGVALVTFCKAQLTRVEQQVSVLEDSMLKAFGSEVDATTRPGGRR